MVYVEVFALQRPAVLASFQRFLHSPRALVLAAALAFAFAAFSLYFARREDRISILLAAGDARGRRAEIAQALADEAVAHGLDVTVVESAGSEDSREMVERREVDVALVQGGLDGNEDVREVAPLVLESLHLLVRGDSDIFTLEDHAVSASCSRRRAAGRVDCRWRSPSSRASTRATTTPRSR